MTASDKTQLDIACPTVADLRRAMAQRDGNELVEWLRAKGMVSLLHSAIAHDDPYLDDLVGESDSTAQIYGSLADSDPWMARRALALTHVAQAARLWRHSRSGGIPALLWRAASLWADETPPAGVNPVSSPPSFTEEQQAAAESHPLKSAMDEIFRALRSEWQSDSWNPIEDAVHRLGTTPERPAKMVRMLAAIADPNSDAGYEIGVLTLTISAELAAVSHESWWPDPLTMGLVPIDGDLARQLSDAWVWARNQDRFGGGSVRWALLNAEGVPAVHPWDAHVGAAAAVGLAYLCNLGRARRPRSDALLAARLTPSGALLPISPGALEVSTHRRPDLRVVAHPVQTPAIKRSGVFKSIASALTVSEAVKKVRQPRVLPKVIASLTSALLLISMLQLAHERLASTSLLQDQIASAARLVSDADASRQTAPDRALLLDVAASALDPSNTTVRADLGNTLYGDARLKAILPTPVGHSPLSIAFSADSKKVATTDSRGEVIVWETATRRISKTFEVGSKAQAIAFSPDAHWMAVGDEGSTVTMFDLNSSAAQYRYRFRTGSTGVRSLAFSTDSRLLAASDSAGSVSFADFLAERSALTTVPFSHGSIQALSFVGKTSQIIFGCQDGTVGTIDTQQQNRSPKVIAKYDSPIKSVSGEPTGSTLYIAESASRVNVLTVPAFTQASSPIKVPFDSRVLFENGQSQLLVASSGGILSIYANENGGTTSIAELKFGDYSLGVGLPGAAEATVSPNGELVAATTATGAILVWSSTGPRSKLGYARNALNVWPVPNTDTTVVVDAPFTGPAPRIELIRRSTGKIESFQDVTVPTLVKPIIFSAKLSLVAAITTNRTVVIWRIQGDRLYPIATISQPAGSAQSTPLAIAFDNFRSRLLISRGNIVDEVPVSPIGAGSEKEAYRLGDRIGCIVPLSNGQHMALCTKNGVEALPLNLDGSVVGPDAQLTSDQEYQVEEGPDSSVLTGSTTGTVTLNRFDSGQWSATAIGTLKGTIESLGTAGGLIVASSMGDYVQVFTSSGDQIVNSRFTLNSVPRFTYQEGDYLKVTAGWLLGEEYSLAIVPSAQRQEACSIGGWGGTGLRIRDVEGGLPDDVNDTALCPSPNSPQNLTATSTSRPPSPASLPSIDTDSYGTLAVGMNRQDAVTAAGVPLQEGMEHNGCTDFFDGTKTGGLHLLITAGSGERVVGIQPPSAARTAEGVGVGSTRPDVQKAYPASQIVEVRTEAGDVLMVRSAKSNDYIGFRFGAGGNSIVSVGIGSRAYASGAELCSG